MPERLIVLVDGQTISVTPGSTVAVAVALAGRPCRRSVTGEPRSAVCGMGICFECRVTIDGELHRRSCQILCRAGMEVQTNG